MRIRTLRASSLSAVLVACMLGASGTGNAPTAPGVSSDEAATERFLGPFSDAMRARSDAEEFARKGDHRSAEAAFLRGVEIVEHSFGENAPVLTRVLGPLARFHRSIERFDDAIGVHERILRVLRIAGQDRSIRMAFALEDYARTLTALSMAEMEDSGELKDFEER